MSRLALASNSAGSAASQGHTYVDVSDAEFLDTYYGDADSEEEQQLNSPETTPGNIEFWTRGVQSGMTQDDRVGYTDCGDLQSEQACRAVEMTGGRCHWDTESKQCSDVEPLSVIQFRAMPLAERERRITLLQDWLREQYELDQPYSVGSNGTLHGSFMARVPAAVQEILTKTVHALATSDFIKNAYLHNAHEGYRRRQEDAHPSLFRSSTGKPIQSFSNVATASNQQASNPSMRNAAQSQHDSLLQAYQLGVRNVPANEKPLLTPGLGACGTWSVLMSLLCADEAMYTDESLLERLKLIRDRGQAVNALAFTGVMVQTPEDDGKIPPMPSSLPNISTLRAYLQHYRTHACNPALNIHRNAPLLCPNVYDIYVHDNRERQACRVFLYQMMRWFRRIMAITFERHKVFWRGLPEDRALALSRKMARPENAYVDSEMLIVLGNALGVRVHVRGDMPFLAPQLELPFRSDYVHPLQIVVRLVAFNNPTAMPPPVQMHGVNHFVGSYAADANKGGPSVDQMAATVASQQRASPKAAPAASSHDKSSDSATAPSSSSVSLLPYEGPWSILGLTEPQWIHLLVIAAKVHVDIWNQQLRPDPDAWRWNWERLRLLTNSVEDRAFLRGEFERHGQSSILGRLEKVADASPPSGMSFARFAGIAATAALTIAARAGSKRKQPSASEASTTENIQNQESKRRRMESTSAHLSAILQAAADFNGVSDSDVNILRNILEIPSSSESVNLGALSQDSPTANKNASMASNILFGKRASSEFKLQKTKAAKETVFEGRLREASAEAYALSLRHRHRCHEFIRKLKGTSFPREHYMAILHDRSFGSAMTFFRDHLDRRTPADDTLRKQLIHALDDMEEAEDLLSACHDTHDAEARQDAYGSVDLVISQFQQAVQQYTTLDRTIATQEELDFCMKRMEHARRTMQTALHEICQRAKLRLAKKVSDETIIDDVYFCCPDIAMKSTYKLRHVYMTMLRSIHRLSPNMVTLCGELDRTHLHRMRIVQRLEKRKNRVSQVDIATAEELQLRLDEIFTQDQTAEIHILTGEQKNKLRDVLDEYRREINNLPHRVQGMLDDVQESLDYMMVNLSVHIDAAMTNLNMYMWSIIQAHANQRSHPFLQEKEVDQIFNTDAFANSKFEKHIREMTARVEDVNRATHNVETYFVRRIRVHFAEILYAFRQSNRNVVAQEAARMLQEAIDNLFPTSEVLLPGGAFSSSVPQMSLLLSSEAPAGQAAPAAGQFLLMPSQPDAQAEAQTHAPRRSRRHSTRPKRYEDEF